MISNGNRCIVCNSQTFMLPLCRTCRNSKFNVQNAVTYRRCRICGQELISSQDTCLICRESPVLTHTDKVIPLFPYRLWNKDLLYNWKIKGERYLSPFFAGLFYEALVALNQKIVVPVPPRKGKIKKNGWDQIDEVCRFLSNKYNLSVIKLLERNSVQQQKKLNREERLDTIKDAYSLIEKPPLIPEEVCLIDDVCTTGSTIECCAKILKAAGVKKVNVVTLFVVD